MTYEELKNDVTALGFEKWIEDENLLTLCANRALELIYTERPVSRTRDMLIEKPEICNLHKRIALSASESVTLPLSGRAYSFLISGSGSYTVIDGDEVRRVDFSTDMSSVRDFISVGGSICFECTSDCLIRGYVNYKRIIAATAEDIPEYGRYRAIDPARQYKDFRSFASMPRDSRGRIPDGVRMREGQIFLPWDFDGELTICYNRSPSRIISDEPTTAIDVPEDVAHLLPLLCASFMWLDDDAEKARYYMALYRQTISGINLSVPSTVENNYVTNGWA